MTVSVTLDHPEIPAHDDRFAMGDSGDVCIRTGAVAMDNSYPNTGGTIGEPLAASAFGLDSILFAWFGPASGYFYEYVISTAKLRVYYGDLNAVADGAFIEVPNATDLHVVGAAVPFLVIGRRA